MYRVQVRDPAGMGFAFASHRLYMSGWDLFSRPRWHLFSMAFILERLKDQGSLSYASQQCHSLTSAQHLQPMMVWHMRPFLPSATLDYSTGTTYRCASISCVFLSSTPAATHSTLAMPAASG